MRPSRQGYSRGVRAAAAPGHIRRTGRRRFPAPGYLLRPTALGNVLAAMTDRGPETPRWPPSRPSRRTGVVRPASGTYAATSHPRTRPWCANSRISLSECVITYRGADHTVAGPAVVNRATAGLAYPRYERVALRLLGINEFVLLRHAPVDSAPGRGEPGAGG